MTEPIKVGATRAVYALVVACFFLSGLAALIYQTAWLRQFSIVFGTSELAVAAVLAAYMGGLGAGAAVIARLQNRIEHPVRVYGLLEAGIALSALAVPLLIAVADTLQVAILGAHSDPPAASTVAQGLFQVLVAFIVLAVPTGLMGATLPLLARYAVRSDSEVGPRVGLLYAINTAGAVAGTIVAAFALLPSLGLRNTVWCAVLVNGVVFFVARECARRANDRGLAVRERSAGKRGLAPLLESAREQPAWMLPLMLVSGAVAFSYEVLWTRLLSHVVGGSIYAFAIMLAAFLSGIAIGGGVGGRLALRRRQAALSFAGVQIGIGLAAALVYAWMGALIPQGRDLGSLAVYAVAVMLPATVLIGATFPLAVRCLARDERDAADATARVYTWNTLGAISGAILSGFWFLPRLGFEGFISLAVSTNLVLALLTLLLTRRTNRLATGALAMLVAAVAIGYAPDRPSAVVTHRPFLLERNGTVNEVFYAVGRTTTVLVEEADGRLALRTNGLPEASIGVKGSLPIGHIDRWLTALPIAARPSSETLLIVGLGGGTAIEDVPDSVSTIDVVELEPAVVDANRAIAGVRRVDPLVDPRVHLIMNDARNALRLTTKRYDIIVSQPSHPWTAGASHLYTKEFAELAKEHLAPAGVFVQWIGTGFVTDTLLRGIAASLVDVFASVRLYQTAGSALLLIASEDPIDIERSVLETGAPLRSEVLGFSYLGLNGADDFAAALVMDAQAVRDFAADSTPVTDDLNRMATDSRVFADGLGTVELVDRLVEFDSMLDPMSRVHRELAARIDFVNVARRWIHDGFVLRAERLSRIVESPSQRAFIAGLVHGARGETDAARIAFEQAFAGEPQSNTILFALVEPRLPMLAAGRADPDTRRLASGLRGSAASVAQGWELAAAQRWAELARLDDALAAANPTDLWYPEAVRLRADWRLRGAHDPRYARDAVRLIDRALMIRPSLELLLLRAAASDMLDADAEFVETARDAMRFARSTISTGALREARARDSVRRNLIGLRERLDSFGDRVPRAREVAREIGRVVDAI